MKYKEWENNKLTNHLINKLKEEKGLCVDSDLGERGRYRIFIDRHTGDISVKELYKRRN